MYAEGKEVIAMIALETVLTVEQCQQLGIPTQVREHRIVMFLATTPEIVAAIVAENHYLQDEIILYTAPFSQGVKEILGLKDEGVVLIDRNLKIRQSEITVNQHKISQNLMQLISACGCDLSDQY